MRFLLGSPEETAPLTLPDVDVSKLNSLYEDNESFLKVLPLQKSASMNWLAYSEMKLYHLQLYNDKYLFQDVSSTFFAKYKELINNDYFVNMSFRDTIKDKGGVRLISPEEFKEEENKIISDLRNFQLAISDTANEFYIVKDMDISQYPHNLFLNQNGEFITKNIPVTNVLSTEWFLQANRCRILNSHYTKSIWIPTDTGDYALNYLYSNIEECLSTNNFNIYHQKELASPLASDINIICSHGAKNISETQIVFQDEKPTYNLNSIIGDGKILIFFVCYSGSMKTEFFKNSITSVVKRFIAQGYNAVIAPFWALDVTIPRYWLPEFLNSINQGETIAQATFNANKKVYEKYPTPAAWACLHLYGNPNIQIE